MKESNHKTQQRMTAIRGAAAAFLTGAVLTVTGAGPAHAISDPSDNMDAGVATRWSSAGEGAGSMACLPTGGHPVIVPGGRIRLTMPGAGWHSAARDVTGIYVSGHPASWVEFRVFLKGAGKVNLEVIDPDTWRYLGLEQVTITNDWQGYFVHWSKPARQDVVFRVSVVGVAGHHVSFADIDDFRIFRSLV